MKNTHKYLMWTLIMCLFFLSLSMLFKSEKDNSPKIWNNWRTDDAERVLNMGEEGLSLRPKQTFFIFERENCITYENKTYCSNNWINLNKTYNELYKEMYK